MEARGRGNAFLVAHVARPSRLRWLRTSRLHPGSAAGVIAPSRDGPAPRSPLPAPSRIPIPPSHVTSLEFSVASVHQPPS